MRMTGAARACRLPASVRPSRISGETMTDPVTITDPPAVTPAAGKPGPARRRRRRSAWPKIAAVLVVLGGAGAGYWFTRGEKADPAADLITQTVTRGDIEDTVSAVGELQPVNYVDVGAQVSGQLTRLLVDVGDQVTQGDLLAEIDARSLSYTVDSNRAEVENLKAQLVSQQARTVLADLQLARQQQMRKVNATSQESLQSAEADAAAAHATVDSLKAQIRKAEATLGSNETTLGYARIYAPMTGTIASTSARQGQTLNANQTTPTILRVSDLATMRVEADVSEADVSRLKVGMGAYFTILGLPDRRWTGHLSQIEPTPTVTNNVVLYTALFDVDNATRELMIQMSAQVFFVVAEAKDVVLVPRAALRRLSSSADAEGNRTAEVRVLGADGQTETRTVTIGVTDRVAAEVRKGLSEGDRVITGSRSATAAAAARQNQNQRRSGPGGPPPF